jgi:hypothetical protein
MSTRKRGVGLKRFFLVFLANRVLDKTMNNGGE